MPKLVGRVLMVEDNPGDVYLFRHFLRKLSPGTDFQHFNSGISFREWLEKVERGSIKNFPDLLIMDVNLPGFTGYELVREVRNLPELDHTRIVMFSSAEPDKTKKEIMELAVAYMIKPMEPGDYQDVVQSIHALAFGKEGGPEIIS